MMISEIRIAQLQDDRAKFSDNMEEYVCMEKEAAYILDLLYICTLYFKVMFPSHILYCFLAVFHKVYNNNNNNNDFY